METQNGKYKKLVIKIHQLIFPGDTITLSIDTGFEVKDFSVGKIEPLDSISIELKDKIEPEDGA